MPLFWFFLVLSAAVLVLVIVDCIILGLRFRDTIKFHRYPSQHRNDSLELPFHGQAQCCIQSARCNKSILDGGTFKCRSTSNVKETSSVLGTTFAVTFRNIQRDRLGGSQPLITSMAMEPRQRFGDRERIGCVFERQAVNIESIMVKDGLGHRRCFSISSTSTITGLGQNGVIWGAIRTFSIAVRPSDR